MKIAISSQGDDLSAKLDPRFGRASGFIIYDLDTDKYEYISNAENARAPQGAGGQAAQTVARSGADVIISGHIGPKAYAALSGGGMTIYLAQEGTIQEVIQAFKNGKLQSTQGADKPGHW